MSPNTRFFTQFSRIALIGCLSLAGRGLAMEDVLDCTEAWKRIVSNSPAMEAANLEVEIKHAVRWQAGMVPNPLLSIEWDSFGGSGDYRGIDKSSGQFSVTQIFELGGKRCRRVLVADANIGTAETLEESVKLDLLAGLTLSMLELAAMQEKLKLKEQMLALAEESFKGFTSKVEGGRASLLAKRKNGIEKATRQIEVDVLRNDLKKARYELCKRWGDEEPDFREIAYPLFSLAAPPPFEELSVLLPNNPSVQRWDSELTSYSEVIALERANRIPNLAVSTGITSEYGCANNAFFMEFSFVLPLFDQNQANIRRAELAYCQLEWQRQDAFLKVQAELRTVWEEWDVAYRKAKLIQEEIIPAAEESAQMTGEGNVQGKFEYQEVIAAKKDWLEAQVLLIDALVDLHRHKIEAQRLIGFVQDYTETHSKLGFGNAKALAIE